MGLIPNAIGGFSDQMQTDKLVKMVIHGLTIL